MKIIRLLCIGLLAQVIAATAQVPTLLNYQGYLQDASGNPATGTVNIAIALYTNATGGAAVYSEIVGSVPLDKGVYSFQYGINSAVMANALTNASVWMELTLNAATLIPRQRLVAVPYALVAVRASDTEMLGGLPASQYLTSDMNTSVMEQIAQSRLVLVALDTSGQFTNQIGGFQEYFTLASGRYGSVLVSTTTLYYANSAYQPVRPLSTGNRTYSGESQTYTMNVNTNVRHYTGYIRIYGGTAPKSVTISFIYANNSTGIVSFGTGQADFLVTNPFPSQVVSAIQTTIQGGCYEENIVIWCNISGQVCMKLGDIPTAGKNKVGLFIHRGSEEPGEVLSYTMTGSGGAQTITNINKYSVLNPIGIITGLTVNISSALSNDSTINSSIKGVLLDLQ